MSKFKVGDRVRSKWHPQEYQVYGITSSSHGDFIMVTPNSGVYYAEYEYEPVPTMLTSREELEALYG